MVDVVVPDGVSKGQPGAVTFWSQRWTGRPYLDCLMYAGSMLVGFAGVAVGADFGHRLRVASGDTAGGTSVADLRVGMEKLLPWVKLFAGWRASLELTRTALLSQMYGVVIDFSKVPARHPLRRFVGSYTGWHACVIAGARQDADGLRLWWFDPMAPEGHTGRWLLAHKVIPWLSAEADGDIRVFWTEKGQGLVDFPMPEVAVLLAQIEQLKSDAVAQGQLLQVATDGLKRIGDELLAERGRRVATAAEAVAVALALRGVLGDIGALADRLAALDVQGGQA